MTVARRARISATALVVMASITGPALVSSPAGAQAAQPHATSVHIVSSVTFSPQRVGTVGSLRQIQIGNNGSTPVTVKGIAFASGNRTDFIVATGCFPSGSPPRTLAPGAVCTVALRFVPRALGRRTATLRVTTSAPGSPHSVTLRGTGTQGYYVAGVGGGVVAFGDARFRGDLRGTQLSAPIIGLTTTPNGAGYWLLGTDGGIFAFGNARFFGSTGAMRLNRPVLAMASTPSGKGYWLVASDGGIFSFGDARFFGSTGAIRLSQPIVGMASTPLGRGYWLVAADGGIFTFGDATFSGSTGGGAFGLMTGMAVSSNGRGYWLSNTAGQIFPFGNAPYYGDTYRNGASVLAPLAATAPKLRPPGFAGTVLYLKNPASAAAASLPRAVPRLDGH